VISVQVDPFSDVGPTLEGGVVSIGNFDGVHRGHCRLLARLRQRSRETNARAIAVSFEPHPLRLIRPQAAPEALVWPERKEELLLAAGADQAILLATSTSFLNLSANAFFHDVVLGRLHARGMVEGRNFCYGQGRSGTIEILAEQCHAADIGLDVIDIIHGDDAREISSSQVRRELALGRVEQATEILGRPHRLKGLVVQGDQRGRTIGFPTANLAHVPVIIPGEGVYACRAWVKGRSYPAAVNIGGNPTFGIDQRKVEAHLIEFVGDLYNQSIELDLLRFVREVRPFPSLDELKNQLHEDVEFARQVEKSYRHPFGCDLGQTIREWLDMELTPLVEPIGGKLGNIRLEGDELSAAITFAGPTIPSVAISGLPSWEDRLRRTFPEVQSIHWEAI
jgi:riboflavin kinase / FMN adenylyltransferase